MVRRKMSRANKFKQTLMTKQGKGILLVVAVAVLLLFGSSELFLSYPIGNYGDIVLYNGRNGELMDDTTVLSIEDGDFLVVMLVEKDPNPANKKPTDVDFTAIVQYYPDNTIVDDVQDRNVVNDYSYEWTFDLTDYEHETRVYHVKIFGFLGGNTYRDNSHTFQITYDASESAYDDVVWVNVPADAEFSGNQSPALISWTFDYDSLCEATLTRNGAMVDSEMIPADYQQDSYDYSVDTSVAGEFTFILTIVPDIDVNPAVSDTVMVAITGEDDNGDDNGDDNATIPGLPTFTAKPPDAVNMFANETRTFFWNVSDDNPSHYALYQNGTLVQTGWVITEVFSYPMIVANFTDGVHSFTFEYVDADGNSISHTMILTVTDGFGWENWIDENPMMVIVILIGAVVLFGGGGGTYVMHSRR